MKQRWSQWSQLFAARAPREKWLIVVSSVVALMLIMQTLLIDPLLEQHKEGQQKLLAQQSTNQRMQSEVIVLQRELAKDPDAEVNQQLAKLQAQSQELSQQLSALMSNLVSPSQMAELLQSVLDKSAKLKVVSLTSLAATPINSVTSSTNETNSKNSVSTTNETNSKNVTSTTNETTDNGQYFLHPVRMELTGTYWAIRDYLHALENLPVKYYWRSFQYQVETYPNAKLILEVYTLGTREEFIGG